jgi:hypothetical protein
MDHFSRRGDAVPKLADRMSPGILHKRESTSRNEGGIGTRPVRYLDVVAGNVTQVLLFHLSTGDHR